MNSSDHFKAGCGVLIFAALIFCMACICVNSIDFATWCFIFFIIIVAVIIAIIFWAASAYKKTEEILVYIGNAVIDIFTIKKEVKQKCPAALKAVILEKKKQSVNVGIYDNSNSMIEKMNISCNASVTDNIYAGQVIQM